MILAKTMAAVSMMALLLATAGVADAARANNMRGTGMHAVSGMVVDHQGRAVSGAHVHVKRQHRARAAVAGAAKTQATKAQTAKTMTTRAHAHSGTMSAANGAFSLRHRHTGMITLVAHKKGVGKGHATVAAGTNINNVTIRLHTLHHHHA